MHTLRGANRAAIAARAARSLILVALLIGVWAGQGGAVAQPTDGEIVTLTLSSETVGALTVRWATPTPAPDDYRLSWARADLGYLSYADPNEDQRGNEYPAADATALTLSGLTPGAEYQVQLRSRYHVDGSTAVLRSGPWRAAGPLRVLDDPAPTPAPAAPTGLIAVAGDGLVDLTWTAPADNGSVINGYGILRGPSAEALATLVVDTNSTQAFYRDETVEAGADYVYAVVALSADAESRPSATARVTVPEESSEQEPGGGGQPAPPTGLVALVGDGVVDLVWAAPSDNDNDNDNEIVITGYRIMRGANAGALATLVADSRSPLTFYRDETVEAGANYVYALVALSAGGESPPSATASVTIPALTSVQASGESDPLAAPTGLRAEASDIHVILTWDAADDDTISGYRVLRGPDAGRLTELASDTRSAFATYVDHAVEPETKYAYAVQAIRSGDVGPQSEAVSTRTREPAEAGTLAARAISDHIAVSNLNRTTGGSFSFNFS